MRCQKNCSSSGKRCRRTSQSRSRYCWQHQSSSRANLYSDEAFYQFGGALLTHALKFAKPKKGQWDIYGRESCPYTMSAVNYAHSRFVEPVVFYDITKFNPPISTQQLAKKLGKLIGNQRTIPMIFDPKNRFVGGASDLEDKF